MGDRITNKTSAVLALLLFTMVLFGILSQSALANFKPYQSPELHVLSPLPNVTYNTIDVPLNVTIQLYGYYQGGITAEGLSWLNYSLDGHAGHELPVTALPNDYWPTPVLNGSGNVMLSGLSDGRHWIEVFGETSFNTTFNTGLIFFTVNAQLFSMPEEQVNYTISQIGDIMWAKIDGTYPITYSGSEASIPMVYPIPPETTNISIWMNGEKLSWSNFTETNPEALHRTALGNWSEILTLLENVSGSFVMRIHYEHPLQVINGSYVFLYDLNIAEYLSPAENKSVAHFTITMDTNYTHLRVSTVDPETETLKPINFTVSNASQSKITIDEVSELDKPLPGDLLVSFSGSKANTDNVLLTVVIAVVIGLTVAGLAAYILVRRRRKSTIALNDS